MSSNIKSGSLYDIEAEEETIFILRAQNKKINELYEEIERKDQVIYNIQNDTTKYEDFQRQIKNYKNQILTQEDKIKTLENTIEDLNKSSSENLKRASDVENILRTQINSKEKIIFELNETIKQYENQISKYKNDLNEKSLTIVKLRNNNEDLETSFKNSLLKLSLSDEEIKSLKTVNESIIKEMNDIKMKFEDKIDELVDLIKQQNVELTFSTQNFKKIEKENFQLKSLNSNYKKEIEYLIENMKQIKENIEKFSKIEERVKESEILIQDLQNILESEKNKNGELQLKLIEVNEKNNFLTTKVSDNEKLVDIIKSKDDELKNLELRISDLNNVIMRKDMTCKEIEKEILTFSNYVSDYLITITQWVETYLGVYINLNLNSTKNHFSFEVPDLNFEKLFDDNENHNYHGSIHHITNYFDCLNLNSRIEKFSNVLMTTRVKINEELMVYDDNVSELKDLNANLMYTNEELNKETSIVKKENFELSQYLNSEKEANKNLKLEIKSLKEILNSVDFNKKEMEKSFIKFLENFLMDFKEAKKIIKENYNKFGFEEFTEKFDLKGKNDEKLESMVK